MRSLRILVVTALVLTAGVVPPATAGDSPRVTIETLSNKVLDVLRDKGADLQQKRKRIENLISADVDWITLSRLVLGRHWAKFNPQQQEEFVGLFREHLSLTYSRAIESYTDEKLQVQNERAEARGDTTVQTKILRGGHSEDILIDYRLRKDDAGNWKIIDFIVERVSLVANYRSQFQSVLGSDEPQKLLTMLREKNRKGEPLKAPGA
jgi:phospholipid transport system substrate-binding protein